MFYILSFIRAASENHIETASIDEISLLIDDLVFNEINFTLIAIKQTKS